VFSLIRSLTAIGMAQDLELWCGGRDRLFRDVGVRAGFPIRRDHPTTNAGLAFLC